MIYLLSCVIVGLLIILVAIMNAQNDPNEKQYNSTYVVYYNPPISNECKETIKRNIEPSATCSDTEMFEINRIFNIKEMLTIETLSFLNRLEKRGVDYIEF